VIGECVIPAAKSHMMLCCAGSCVLHVQSHDQQMQVHLSSSANGALLQTSVTSNREASIIKRRCTDESIANLH
jgi:hypothetical protein